ncbi:hypothetical protein M8C21_004545, partial [Ambrosia artemisiifolia]
MIEKNGASAESSRNSFSSSCSSTTFSSFDCSRRVQNDWQLPSEPTSPNMRKNKPDWSLPPPDIRDVVKESMTREIRVTKYERASPVMKHIDSPRPFVHQKSIQYDRKDRNLAKIQKSSSVKEVREVSRFSCEERESQYSLKSTFKFKEPPRLSLDSNQDSNWNSLNGPGSNKRPSSGVVARLMGLDSLTDSASDVEPLKIKLDSGDHLVSRSPRLQSKIRPALQQYTGCDRARKPSVYGEMEKMLNELKFNTSGKDLRALKQILETIQMNKTGLKNQQQPLEIQKPDQPCSPTVKGTNSPNRHELKNWTKVATEPKMITGHHDVNHTSRKQVTIRTPKNMNATDRTSSPRLQKPKNGVDKQYFNGPSADSSGIKKQTNLKTKHLRIKPTSPMQNKVQSFRCSSDGDTVSLKSKSKTNMASQSKPEVTRNDQQKKNQKNNFAERLIEDLPMVKLAKHSVEQPSPDSVLDAFFIEDMPSPIKNKQNENLCDDQTEWNQVGSYNLMNNTYVEHVKPENKASPIQQTQSSNSMDETVAYPCESRNTDHGYIREILSASGFLNDLDSAIRQVQLHPTSSLIKPELFHLLKNKDDENIRRKLIFDYVNEILFNKIVNMDGQICGRFMNGEKLLEELWLEINALQKGFRRCTYDEDYDIDDDEVINIVSADLNKRSEDWGTCYFEVPGVVLDIERLIFKDLINEVVNAEVASLPHGQRH